MKVIAESDVVITTAAIPGRKAPVLVTAEMVKAMPAGSIIIDMAAESGGNCVLTKAGEITIEHGVTIDGTINIPTNVPFHSSQMYGKNLTTFLLHLLKEGALDGAAGDEIVRETMVTRGGEVVNARVRDALGLTPLEQSPEVAASIETSSAGEPVESEIPAGKTSADVTVDQDNLADAPGDSDTSSS